MRLFSFLFLIVMIATVSTATVADTKMDLKEGIRLFEEGDHNEAWKYLKTVADEEPETAEAQFSLGRIDFAKKDWDAAVARFERTVELDPTVSTYHLWLGIASVEKLQTVNMLQKMGWAGKAKESFIAAVDADPNDVESRSALTDFYLEAPSIAGGSKEKAMEQIEAIMALDPKAGHERMARYYVQEEDREAALSEYAKLTELDPTDPLAHYLVGSMYRDAEEWDETFAAYEAALKLDPHYMPALYQLGRTGVFSGQNLNRCIECMELYLTMEVPEDSPTWADARWRLGMLYEKKGDGAKARTEFETALRMNPDHEQAKKSLDKMN
ncbi:MAG: tetratricopeptide repeat protein [bacterium]|nr:tetratricopeptide repeat protein [bacterium]